MLYSPSEYVMPPNSGLLRLDAGWRQETVNKEISGGRNALHFAADYGQTDVIQCLIDHGADVNLPDKYGISPLLAAIWESHLDAVKLLLSKGAKKDGKSPDGQSYMDCAETDDIKMCLK